MIHNIGTEYTCTYLTQKTNLFTSFIWGGTQNYKTIQARKSHLMMFEIGLTQFLWQSLEILPYIFMALNLIPCLSYRKKPEPVL